MSTKNSFSPVDFKAHFPLFSQSPNDKLIYLDNAATTQKPKAVLDAINAYYLKENANAHRASHRLARRATESLESARHNIARLLNASPQEIVFCRGATEGLNLVAQSLIDIIPSNSEIILSEAEHHANLLPWQQLAKQKNLKLKYLPLKDGAPDLTALASILTNNTKVLALTGASNVLGAKTNLSALKSNLGDFKPIIVIDAAQLLPHQNIDVQQIPCDFLVFSGHKMFGPMGAGVLYGRQEILEQLPPWQLGGEMVDSVRLFDADYAPVPRRFEAGTLSLADIAGLNAAIEFMNQQDRSAIQSYEHTLISALHNGLDSLPEISCLTRSENNLGIATCTFSDQYPGRHLQDLALWLDEHDIAVRVGQHCAQPLYKAIGHPVGGLRFSVAPYTLETDIDFTLNVLSDWLTMTRPKNSINSLSTVNIPDSTCLRSMVDDLSAQREADLAEQKSWQQRYRLLMQWGGAIAEKPQLRKPIYKVSACETNTWLTHWEEGGRHYFLLDSDSKIVRGLGALLLLWFQGHSYTDITEFNWKVSAENLGLARHLSESRRNGFFALIQQIRFYVEESTKPN